MTAENSAVKPPGVLPNFGELDALKFERIFVTDRRKMFGKVGFEIHAFFTSNCHCAHTIWCAPELHPNLG